MWGLGLSSPHAKPHPSSAPTSALLQVVKIAEGMLEAAAHRKEPHASDAKDGAALTSRGSGGKSYTLPHRSRSMVCNAATYVNLNDLRVTHLLDTAPAFVLLDFR